MTDNELISAVEAAYGVVLPDRLKRFWSEREFDQLSLLHLQRGYLRGCFQPTFDDIDYLCDPEAIGDDFGIDDIADCDWKSEFAGFIPFGVLNVPDAGEQDDDLLGAFLVVHIAEPSCPIYVWEQEGWMIYPLASSLDHFIAGTAWTGAAPTKHDNVGQKYNSFTWVIEVPDEEDEED